ncbi:MAG: Coenzyme F420 hydrogenase/dehydrogenase, beta subunit C-terminal domain [Smithella sp.]
MQQKTLLTCDVVCHGVPSPKVFAAYLSVMESRHGTKVQRIAFRRKNCGWKRYSVALSFDNATEYRRIFTEDPLMIGFLRNIYLRPSCHSCRFSRLPRIADITLGDFWGVGGYNPEWDDDKGPSLLLVQSKKGQRAIDGCRDDLVMHSADLDVAIQSNPCICGSVPPGKNRTAFFDDLDCLPFEGVMKKYMSPPTCWRHLRRDMWGSVHSIAHKLTRMVLL